MREVTIRVKKNGVVEFDFNGFRGRECFRARDKILELLRRKYGVNVDIEYEEKKPEAYVEEEEFEYMPQV
mgnify:CR=1 FL=1